MEFRRFLTLMKGHSLDMELTVYGRLKLIIDVFNQMDVIKGRVTRQLASKVNGLSHKNLKTILSRLLPQKNA
eukprot:gene18581-24307_t